MPNNIVVKPVKNTPLIDIFWGRIGWEKWTRIYRFKSGAIKYLKGIILNKDQLEEIQKCIS
jgi:hypothetical protein